MSNVGWYGTYRRQGGNTYHDEEGAFYGTIRRWHSSVAGIDGAGKARALHHHGSIANLKGRGALATPIFFGNWNTCQTGRRQKRPNKRKNAKQSRAQP